MKSATVIYGTQLFPRHPALAHTNEPVIMIEAYSLCAAYRYHKHKLILVLAAMREYRDLLRANGYTVVYVELSPDTTFEKELHRIITGHAIQKINVVSPEDRTAATALREYSTASHIELHEWESPGFLTPRALSAEWLSGNKKPVMENFYRWQRRRLNILLEDDLPAGGAWNFDTENRKPLPKSGIPIPVLPFPEPTAHVRDVAGLVDTLFPDNPGNSSGFWLPVTRAEASGWLRRFVEERLCHFGTYEDAMATDQPFLFHSVLTPLLNIGLITPAEVVEAVLGAYEKASAPLNSVEGYIRQIIGWREYMRALYWHKHDLKEANYFGFTRELEDWWYSDAYTKQDLPPPLMEALRTVHRYGYNHHIERLMILGNWFLLHEYNPLSVFRWFQTMYVDAYEWVMVPNVQGMSQYADGGYVATKPYISGGNYLQKMGKWWRSAKEAQESAYTQKYWAFLNNNKERLKNNPRMGIALKQAEKRARE